MPLILGVIKASQAHIFSVFEVTLLSELGLTLICWGNMWRNVLELILSISKINAERWCPPLPQVLLHPHIVTNAGYCCFFSANSLNGLFLVKLVSVNTFQEVLLLMCNNIEVVVSSRSAHRAQQEKYGFSSSCDKVCITVVFMAADFIFVCGISKWSCLFIFHFPCGNVRMTVAADMRLCQRRRRTWLCSGGERSASFLCTHFAADGLCEDH